MPLDRRLPRGAVSERQRAALLALSDERDLWLRRVLGAWREGYQRGRGGTYAEGYDFGFDHGYAARQDERAFVRGIIEGFEAGTAERLRWLEASRDRERVRHLASHPVRKAAAS